jgi:plasmid stability protein
MATLYIRDVPGDLYERLREEAHRSHRSIGATVIDLLRTQLFERREPAMDRSAADDIRADYDR